MAKLDNKKTIPALAWLERRGEGREQKEAEEETTFTPVKVVNRNSVEEEEEEEEESDTETDNESSLVAADANQSWPDSEEEEEDANIDFEDFSGTDTEDEEGGFELSDTDEEDEEERDKFEELAIPPDRRASTVSQIPMHPIEQGEPSKLVESPKSVRERETGGEKVREEVGNGGKGFEGLVQVKEGGGLIRLGSQGEPFVPLVQREVKLQHSQSMCGIR